MKKTLLSLGTIVSAVAPVASVIACGDGDVPGHEAPYSISIHADTTTPTQGNIEIVLKGYASESYIKEIKSRIAESIAAANKNELKYSTFKLLVGGSTIPINEVNRGGLIHETALTNTNKNDLDAIHNIIDTSFDNLMYAAKTSEEFRKYFKKEVWENMHNQIDKLDQKEVKLKLLKLFGFENITNPDVIDFKYEVLSNKCIDFTIIRTNVTSTPELVQHVFSAQDTGFPPFLEGEKINIRIFLNSANKYPNTSFDSDNDSSGYWYNPKIQSTPSSKYGAMGLAQRQSHVHLYKIIKYLLKANGYSDDIIFGSMPESGITTIDDDVKVLGNSASKVFAYGDNGQFAGINMGSTFRKKRELQIDFDKKTFKIKYSPIAFDQKQWIFGTDGHLVIEPTKEWTMEFEGTYELNDAGDAIETIPSLTKTTATDGTNIIHLLESSSKLIIKSILNVADDIHLF